MLFQCSKCKKKKEKENFPIDKRREIGISSWCRDCNNIELNRQRKIANKKKFNMSEEQFNNRSKNCEICNISEEDNKERTGRELSFDHCHITGKFRGMLCTRCNRGIGLFDDSCYLTSEASKYLIRTKLKGLGLEINSL